jgi:putative ABC transport system permease protein
MIINYFKTALRSIVRQKGYSFINIAGLAIGMACCLLILMFVNDELGYDSYNEHAGRIYRVAGSFKFGGRDFDVATVPAPMAKTLKTDYHEVEQTVRFRDQGSFIVKYGDNSFKEQKFIFSDPTFFSLFTIPLLKGNPATALEKPFTLVLSKKTAEKYFGGEDPVGKTLKIDNKDDYMVTGVFAEIPHNSHFHFDIIASLESLEESREQMWLSNNFNTYLLLGKNADPKALEAKFPEVIKKYFAPQVEKYMGKSLDSLVESGNISVAFYLQPLRGIHLYSGLASELEPNSDIKYIYIFSAIA